MTAPSPYSFANSSPVTRSAKKPNSSRHQHGAKLVKKLSRNSVDHETASRKWFAALLWKAFPSPSEHDLSIKAASVLDVSPRQVRNWLRCENDASLKYVTAVALIAGVEFGLSRIGGRA